MRDSKTPIRRSSIFLGEEHTSLFNRLNAKAIDLVVVIAVYLLGKAIWVPFGLLVAATFCSLQDAFGVGQSIGKRIIGLRVIEDPSEMSCSFRSSCFRNLPFTIVILCDAVPIFGPILIALSLPIVALEIYLIATLDSGIRLGDVLGNTLVVEYQEQGI